MYLNRNEYSLSNGSDQLEASQLNPKTRGWIFLCFDNRTERTPCRINAVGLLLVGVRVLCGAWYARISSWIEIYFIDFHQHLIVWAAPPSGCAIAVDARGKSWSPSDLISLSFGTSIIIYKFGIIIKIEYGILIIETNRLPLFITNWITAYGDVCRNGAFNFFRWEGEW